MTQNPVKNSAPVTPFPQKKSVRESTFPDDVYSDDVINRLSERHGIQDEAQMKLLSATLHFASGRYLVIKRQESMQLSPSEIKKHLTVLSRSAKGLARQLEQLPPKAKEVFLSAEGELQGELEGRVYEAIHQREASPLSRMEQANTGKFVVVRNGETPGGWQDTETRIEYTSYADIEAALRQIQLISETALGYLQPDKGGRPENKAVFAWTRLLSDFWVKDLKRPYRVDGYKGEVITDAGNFLTDCLRPLDPSAIDLLYSQMRRYCEKA